MNKKEVTEFFVDLPNKEKAAFLCCLAFELTVLARETYEVGTDDLENSALMRSINEVQHRILSHASRLLREVKSRELFAEYESNLWQTFFDSKDEELQKVLKNAVSHVLTQFAPVLV